jgi:hypothetical protein
MALQMNTVSSTKSPQGRPKLSPLEKQRRLVARLQESLGELERIIEEESGHLVVGDDLQRHLLLSTFFQRLNYAREAARHEQDGITDMAKSVRQKLNLFRPQGFTEEAWNALPDDEKRLAPGKPKMPKELELARLELDCDEELRRLREMEAAAGEEESDIETLRAQHGTTKIGRPGKDVFGALDRQMRTAFYKRRDLARHQNSLYENEAKGQSAGVGRPRKSYEDRYAYFTSIIDHCRKQIANGEEKLDLVDLQLRYLKRLRDRANRIRLQIKTTLGPDLVRLKNDLVAVEAQTKCEAELLSDFQDEYITLTNDQIDVRRKSVASKIEALDAIEFSDQV